MKLQTVDCSMLRVEAGDRIVVKVPFGLSLKQIDQIRRSVEKWAGSSIPVLVTMPGVEIEIIKSDVSPICG